MQDVHPTIIVDRRIGEKYERFDIDVERLTGYLDDRGMSSEDIGELTISFADNGEDQQEPGTVLSGFFSATTKAVYVNVGGLHNPLQQAEAQGDDLLNWEHHRADAATLTLIHELDHALADAEGTFWTNQRFMAAVSGFGYTAIYGALLAPFYFSEQIMERYPLHVAAISIGAALTSSRLAYSDKVKFNAYKQAPMEKRARAAESDDFAHMQGVIDLGAPNNNPSLRIHARYGQSDCCAGCYFRDPENKVADMPEVLRQWL